MERPSFPCPNCGSKNVKVLSSKHDRCFRPFTDGDVSETEPAITYALQCQCGIAFTETVRQGLGKGLGKGVRPNY